VIAPRFEEIDNELALLSEFRDKPAGKLRITAGEHCAITILQSALSRLLPDNPDLNIEIIVDYGFTDIVAEGFDAGVRLGQQVAKDMIAMRIGPDMRMAVVGSPAYFVRYPKPVIPGDLMAHNCITLRMPTHGGLFLWEFEKDGQELKVRVEGQLVFNNIAMRLEAALQGLGLAYMPEDLVQEQVAQGRLIRVLEDWCEPFSGYHLYYPSRRQSSPAFTLLREALRYVG
jgi:Transcriptional regulator